MKAFFQFSFKKKKKNLKIKNHFIENIGDSDIDFSEIVIKEKLRKIKKKIISKNMFLINYNTGNYSLKEINFFLNSFITTSGKIFNIFFLELSYNKFLNFLKNLENYFLYLNFKKSIFIKIFKRIIQKKHNFSQIILFTCDSIFTAKMFYKQFSQIEINFLNMHLDIHFVSNFPIFLYKKTDYISTLFSPILKTFISNNLQKDLSNKNLKNKFSKPIKKKEKKNLLILNNNFFFKTGLKIPKNSYKEDNKKLSFHGFEEKIKKFSAKIFFLKNLDNKKKNFFKKIKKIKKIFTHRNNPALKKI
jgi:hypothetical protein